MTHHKDYTQTLTEALESSRVSVTQIADTLNLSSGKGLTANKVNIDPLPLFERLDQESPLDPTRMKQLIGGYVSGVVLSMGESKFSTADTVEYEEVAGGMLSNVEVDTFILGVEAVLGVKPWYEPFNEERGLIQVVYLSLNRGTRPLTQDLVERWGSTTDRIFSAARSMLFHRTRDAHLDRAKDASHPDIQQVSKGDGYDAARSLVLPDVFFIELNEPTFHFAMPSKDLLLFVDASDKDTEKLQALHDLAKTKWSEADYPLDHAVYTLKTTQRPYFAELKKAE